MLEKASYIMIRPLDGDNGFLAYAVGIDGCAVEGRTEEESLANLKAVLAGNRTPQSDFAGAA